MTITVNPDLNLVVEQPLSRLPLAVVKLPRGPKVPIWVQFARDGAVIDPSEALTSGTLVVGLYYKITAFVAGDSFTNVGAASNATSVYFLCTGTTPTTWTNSSTLQQCDSAGVLFSLIFSVKKNGEYDGAVLVLASGTDFTKFGTGTSTIFKSKCSFSTAEINTLLGVDASVANDESEVTLMGEVSWLGPDESKAFPFQIDLQNDSYKTNDVVTSTPGVQAMSLVTTSAEAILTGSRVITGSSTVTVTSSSGLVTLTIPSDVPLAGNPTTTTQTAGNNTTRIATTAFVTAAVAAIPSGVTIGSTAISSGTTTRVLYDNAGVLGEYTISGTGSVAMTTSPTFTTPALGTPSALVGTNITGTASGLTAGNATLAADVDPAGTDIAAALAGKLPLAGGVMTGAITNNGVINVNIGNGNTSSGTEATAVGQSNNASGSYSSAFGCYNTASGTSFSSAVGTSNTASGINSSAFGDSNTASGINSSAFGSGITNNTANSAEIGPANTEKLQISSAGANLVTASGVFALNGSPLALVSGNLGTPSAIVLTNATGTAASLTAGTVTTNANLTGHVTSVGNAAVLGSFTMAQLSAAVSDGDPAYVGAANTFTGATNTFTLPTTTGTTTTSGIAIAGNSLTTGTGIYLASSTLTSGKALDIQVSGTAAAASQTALNVATAGANGTSGITSNGAVISNTHTGTTSTNVALELTASGGTTNTALKVTAGNIFIAPNNGAILLQVGYTGTGLSNAASNYLSLNANGSEIIRLHTSDGVECFRKLSTNSTLSVTGATTLTGNLTSNGALISVPQALSGNGAVAAVNLTTLTTTIANTGTANTTTTLAAGTNGQTKIISFITDGGFDAVITVTNPAWGGAGTITMNDARDNVMLIYLNSVWQVFINNGCTLA